MAKTLLLEADVRKHIGTKEASRLREQGKIPAIVYGHKKEPTPMALDAHAFLTGLHHGHRLWDIKVDGHVEQMVVKELQYDYLGRSVIHVDLMRVDITERVRVKVPIDLKGTAKGTTEGGVVTEHLNQLEIECVVAEIPETIVVLVKDVGVGDVIHAGGIALPEGVKLLTPADAQVVTCHLVAAAKSTEEAEVEAPTAPEVIREKKPEGEPEAGKS